MKTIIIAIDFSAAAVNAANYGIKLAEVIHADVLLVNVFEVLANYGEMTLDVNVDELTINAKNEMLTLKSELIRNTNTSLNIKTEIMLGVFFDEIEKLCNEIKPYAVLMGSQGNTGLERFFLGSHVFNAMKDLGWPILAVPPEAIFDEIYRLGLAYDFETIIDESIIEKIKLTAEDFKSEIHILNFENKNAFDPDYILKSENLERSLKPFVLKYHFVASETIDKSIIEFIDKNYINLLIVMPKHHSFIEKIFTKSHTKALEMHSHVPILSLRK